MKKLIWMTLCICSGINPGMTQTILTYFETIPDTSVMGLSAADRKKVVEHGLSTNSGKANHIGLPLHMQFDVMDVRNGYIRLTGSFEGHLEMCYWNLTNGQKLIAVYQESCGPHCQIERFDFYRYDGKDFSSIEWFTLIPDIYGAFFTGDMDQQTSEMESKDISASLLFELPRTGKNIIAKMGNHVDQQEYKPYLYGDRMTLIWNDGFFSRGEIYWSAH